MDPALAGFYEAME
jgi:hypothetical protein